MADEPKQEPPPNPFYRGEWRTSLTSGVVEFSTPNPKAMTAEDYEDVIEFLELILTHLRRRHRRLIGDRLHGEQAREGGAG